MLSYKALSWEVKELEKQKRRAEKELATKSEKLDNRVDATKEPTAKLEGEHRPHETSQNKKRGTTETRSSSGSDGSLKVSACAQRRRRTCKKVEPEVRCLQSCPAQLNSFNCET